jgi:hypothetical protein
MPNWCVNKLEVAGPRAEVSKFIEHNCNDDRVLQFSTSIPTPAELLEGDGWYQWRIANWGTKWELSESETEAFPQLEQDASSEDSVYSSCYFPTAWAPPIAWATKVSELFPKVTLSLWYDEPGMSFAGLYQITDGIVSEKSWEGDSTELMPCSVPGCRELIYGPGAWGRSSASDVPPAFCDAEHQLEREVARVVNS